MVKKEGVALLGRVSDDLDCLYVHLKENPALCELPRRGVGGESRLLAVVKKRKRHSLGRS